MLIDKVLTELAHRAANNNLYFDSQRANCIFVATQDIDHKPLEIYKQLFGGNTVRLGSGVWNSWSGSTLERGEYKWQIHDQEAYAFCRKILPYLAKYAQNKFPYCQQLMMEYMANENNQYRKANS